MEVTPELEQAFERVSASCNSKRCLDAIWKRLADSTQASDEAVKHAHEAWDQLESLNSNMLSIYGLVDPPGTEDLTNAFKEAKLLTRDRVLWQTMGRFRDILDMTLSMDYLSVIVKGNSTRKSQLRHAYYKIHSDMLVQMMGRYDSWQAFAQQLWHNSADSDAQLVLSQINQFKVAGLPMEINDYQSLMQLPLIVQQATRADQLGASCDMARLQRCLESLSRNLSHPDFVDPVQQKINSSMGSSLLATQHAVGAYAVLQALSSADGVLHKNKDDFARKHRKLEQVVEKEIILTACAYLGTGGLADFRFIERVLREQISFRGMPRVHMGSFLYSLRRRHASMQKNLLQELISSYKTWERTVEKIVKAYFKPENNN